METLSEGGTEMGTPETRETKHQRRRRERQERDAQVRAELLERLERLQVGEHDVLVLRPGDEYFDRPELEQDAHAFGAQIAEMAQRPVVLLKHGQAIEAARLPAPPRVVRPEIALPPGARV